MEQRAKKSVAQKKELCEGGCGNDMDRCPVGCSRDRRERRVRSPGDVGVGAGASLEQNQSFPHNIPP